MKSRTSLISLGYIMSLDSCHPGLLHLQRPSEDLPNTRTPYHGCKWEELGFSSRHKMGQK